jgi:hypothetical protein
MTQNANRTRSEPTVGADKTRTSKDVPRFDGATVFGDVGAGDMSPGA